ncbi:LURP-one-related family protein [Allofustis seminis]|uniref:LURP-one-related family protein n=1 Tax=Allofustis seminis TaxID=166939 RepID=UPI00037134CD|nr:LURP-one-related family protein [Allofustis seminis]
MQQLFIHEAPQKSRATFYVTDSSGKVKFVIEGKTHRLHDTLRLVNLDNVVLFKAEQRIITPFSTFDIYKGQQSSSIACFAKHPNFFNWQSPYYTLTPYDWKVTCDFKAEHYLMHNAHEQLLMEIRGCITSRGRQLLVLINSNEYAAIYSLLAVLIEHYAHNDLKEWEFKKKLSYDFGWLNFTKLSPKVPKS